MFCGAPTTPRSALAQIFVQQNTENNQEQTYISGKINGLAQYRMDYKERDKRRKVTQLIGKCGISGFLQRQPEKNKRHSHFEHPHVNARQKSLQGA